ncbi:MAG: Ig-like domain-containing protein [Paludibacteraceae bacterium]|nr:Ig-like domain-containing protein [Paludibacteraceae bacterium]
MDRFQDPVSNDSTVLITGGVPLGFIFGYATMGVGDAVVTYKTTPIKEYHEILESEYNAYKEDKVKPAGWNDYSKDCIKSSQDDDFYGILIGHYYRVDHAPNWNAIEYWTVTKGDPTLSWKSQTGIMNIGAGTRTCPTPTVKVDDLSQTFSGDPTRWWRNSIEVENPSFTYVSSDPTIATVAADGSITALKAGEVTITITWAGDDNWNAAEASYKLTVEKGYAYVYFSSSSLTITEGDTFTEPEATTNPAGLPLTYSSSNEAVATVDATTGKLTIKGAGEATITATFAGNDEYREATRSYTLTVNERQKADPELSFSNSWIYIELGDKFTAPTLSNPHNLPITWSSVDETVATVDQNGNVTIVGVGVTDIKATFAGNSEYYSGETWYSIEVTPHTMNLTVLGVEVNESNCADILGNGKASYNESTRTLTLTDLVADFSSKDWESVKGSAVQDNNWKEGVAPLTVIINGRCEFANTYLAFSGDIGLIFKGDTLVMSGVEPQAQARNITIDGCYVEATSSERYGIPAIMASYKLEVINAGHLYAKSTGVSDGKVKSGLAIITNELVLGENIAILTPGVTFKTDEYGNGGFYTADGELALEVEIGKKPIDPVPDDEETTFDFSVIGPDGSDMLSVSLGANDTYNEDEGRLEVASTATEEDVEAAIEAAVPGSSAFKDLLPSSISFEVEAGEGDIEIDCQTLPGFVLRVRINGVGEASISSTVSQALRGKATVHYNVTQKTYVIIYLQGTPSASAPKRIITSTKDDDPSAGAYIYGIKVTPKKAHSGIGEIEAEHYGASQAAKKVIRNGVIYIIRPDGTVFNAQGARVE